MRKTFVVALFSLLLIWIVSACDAILETQFYASDFMQEEISFKIKTTITTEFSKSDEAELTELLKATFPGAKNFRKVSNGYSEDLQFDYEADVVNAAKFTNSSSKGIFTFLIKRESDSSSSLGIIMDEDKYNQLNDEVADKFMGDVDLEDLKFSVDIINDLNRWVDVNVKSSYVNGDPIPFEKTYSIQRRENVKIIFSEVLKQALINEEVYYFSNIKVK